MPLQVNINARDKVPQDQVYEKYKIDRPAKVIFVGHHLKTSSSLRCMIRTMSLYGAELEVSPHQQMPTNFYLEILGIHDEIGCTLIRREAERVTVGFNMLIDPEFLHHVVRLSFELGH